MWEEKGNNKGKRLQTSQGFYRRRTTIQMPSKTAAIEHMEGLITGHTEINYHRDNFERAANRDCRCGGVEQETTTHIRCDC